jgi:hypothetical protein
MKWSNADLPTEVDGSLVSDESPRIAKNLIFNDKVHVDNVLKLAILAQT